MGKRKRTQKQRDKPKRIKRQCRNKRKDDDGDPQPQQTRTKRPARKRQQQEQLVLAEPRRHVILNQAEVSRHAVLMQRLKAQNRIICSGDIRDAVRIHCALLRTEFWSAFPVYTTLGRERKVQLPRYIYTSYNKKKFQAILRYLDEPNVPFPRGAQIIEVPAQDGYPAEFFASVHTAWKACALRVKEKQPRFLDAFKLWWFEADQLTGDRMSLSQALPPHGGGFINDPSVNANVRDLLLRLCDDCMPANDTSQAGQRWTEGVRLLSQDAQTFADYVQGSTVDQDMQMLQQQKPVENL